MDISKLTVSSTPHIRSKDSTSSIMRDVIIALTPAAIMGVFAFGLYALLVIAISIASCVIFEAGFQKFTKQKITVCDLSAVVTGLLLAMNLPAYVPFWVPIVGGFVAIVIAKQLFGGLGQNFMNPALAGRCFLMLSFSGSMTSFVIQKGSALFGGYQATVDAVSSATPLMDVKEGALQNVDLLKMFLGTTTGTIGETSAVALLLGAIYLLARKIIDWRIPVVYILTFVIFNYVYQSVTGDMCPIVYELCGGGLMLGAFYMATDYVTSPITKKGRVVYAVLLGLLTGLFRFFGESAEGVSFAIIIGNLCVPLIERFTVPRAFGKEEKSHEE